MRCLRAAWVHVIFYMAKWHHALLLALSEDVWPAHVRVVIQAPLQSRRWAAQVLSSYPTTIRRRVLRHLYLQRVPSRAPGAFLLTPPDLLLDTSFLCSALICVSVCCGTCTCSGCHTAHVGIIMHVPYCFPRTLASGLACAGDCLAASPPSTSVCVWRASFYPRV